MISYCFIAVSVLFLFGLCNGCHKCGQFIQRLQQPFEEGSFLIRSRRDTQFDDIIDPFDYLKSGKEHLQNDLVNNFSSSRNNFVDQKSKEQSRKVIIDRFRRLKYDTWTHNFTAKEMKFFNLPPTKGVNIFAILKRSEEPEKKFTVDNDQESVILVGSHYDTIAKSQGVDDNGSGVVGLLELARLFALNKCKFKSTIILVAFDLEEYVSRPSMVIKSKLSQNECKSLPSG